MKHKIFEIDTISLEIRATDENRIHSVIVVNKIIKSSFVCPLHPYQPNLPEFVVIWFPIFCKDRACEISDIFQKFCKSAHWKYDEFLTRAVMLSHKSYEDVPIEVEGASQDVMHLAQFYCRREMHNIDDWEFGESVEIGGAFFEYTD